MRMVRRWEKKYRISTVAIQKGATHVSVRQAVHTISFESEPAARGYVIDAGSTLLISGRPPDITRFAEEFAKDDPS